MNFLVDHHLPIALVRWLQSKGHASTHVCDAQLNRSQDVDIWNYAAQHGQTIISKDEDFIDLALLRTEAVPVVWVRIGNCRKQALIAAMETAWLQIEQKLAAGEQIIEVY
ncbi:MAG: DUF5615 family PIN-like protein [Verrucomicrobiia bacterium]